MCVLVCQPTHRRLQGHCSHRWPLPVWLSLSVTVEWCLPLGKLTRARTLSALEPAQCLALRRLCVVECLFTCPTSGGSCSGGEVPASALAHGEFQESVSVRVQGTFHMGIRTRRRRLMTPPLPARLHSRLQWCLPAPGLQ